MLRSIQRIVIVLFLPVFVFAATPDGRDEPRDEMNQALAHRAEEAASKIRLMKRMESMEANKTANQDLYDVHYYGLDLNLSPSTSTLTGVVDVSAEVVGASIATLDLNLTSNMNVTAISAGGSSVSWTHFSNILTVNLDRTYTTGETVELAVSYFGNPSGDYFGWGSHGGELMIWTLSEPYGARDWWPCKDVNTDKADSLDIVVTVPDNLIVASNGVIVSDVTGGGQRTTHWKTRYPTVTYLVSLAIHPYMTFSTWYTPLGGGPDMEIQHYVFADQFVNAQSAFAPTDEMMTVFANGFGEYPFVNEKYGHASFTWSGGMEHQTLTSIGGLWHDVISHELGHQWFGDMITCADFAHIWLNEGFATWSEAYWKEQSEGVATYNAYMSTAAYMGPGTIIIEDPGNFWTIFDSNLSYNKASWVVHMLRGALGDTDFFAGLAAYRTQYGYGSATTEQFRDVMEGVSGRDLDAFFQQWIYGEYFPVYGFGWNQNAATLELTIDQLQDNTGLFTMPIQVRVTTDVGVTDVTVENALVSESYLIPVAGTVQSVEIDPDDWILCQISSTVTNPTLNQGVLVVNAVDWNSYGTEITTAYADSVYWGAHAMNFWDCFSEPVGGYPANLPVPLGTGSVPADVLGRYSAVVWVGNAFNGDLARWLETPIASYLDAGGNVLLLSRYLADFLEPDLTTRLGITWMEQSVTLSSGLTATAPGLVNMAKLNTQSLLDVFSTTVGLESTLLFEGSTAAGTRGFGAIVEPAAGGTHRPDGGRLAVISARSYRLDHATLRANVEYILSHHFGEPYTPVTAVADERVPTQVTLHANYPNPFNPQTVVPYSLPRAGLVELTVHDAAGRLVRTLLSEQRPAGSGDVQWDGRDDAGRSVASGTYFARLQVAGETQTRPMVLVR